MKKRFAVIGLGFFGGSLARELTRQGAEVLAVDRQMARVEEIKDQVAHAVRLDSTDERALRGQAPEELDAVIVSIGEDFESALLTCVLLKEMGCEHIIVKSTSPIHSRIFRSIGVQQIISPDETIAGRLALTLVSKHILEIVPLPDDHMIIQANAPDFIIGKALEEIHLRRKYGVNLITLSRQPDQETSKKKEAYILGVPMPDTVIREHDILFLMGRQTDLKKFIGE